MLIISVRGLFDIREACRNFFQKCELTIERHELSSSRKKNSMGISESRNVAVWKPKSDSQRICVLFFWAITPMWSSVELISS